MRIYIITLFIIAGTVTALATVTPSWIFSDGVVLQRNMLAPVYGKADVGERVTVQFRGQSLSTTTGAEGKWRVNLKPMSAGGPFTLTITGANTVTINDVLVGEVWVCSGQSNMSYGLDSTAGGAEAIKNSSDPKLRLLHLPEEGANNPRDTAKASWSASSPETSAKFSGIGYYMAQQLRIALKVPVGCIDSSIPGTHIFDWTPHDDLAANPALKQFHSVQGALYNAGIAPLQPFAIRGVAWYQGEWQAENKSPEAEYYELLKTLISGWRRTWGQGDFPFLIVQLPGFDPAQGFWRQTRNAQLNVSRTVANTGLVVTADVMETNTIHPPTKQPIGKRLAVLAEEQVYHKHVQGRSPILQTMKVDKNIVILTFANVPGGLQAKGDPSNGFMLAGADQVFHPATAVIKGKQVQLSCPDVAVPVAVRYNYVEVPKINHFNKAGLPMSPFRTDAWK